ncbi:porin family protein [Aquimarina pacifica]|uniref:porin family protein n=1 Tax=Aquimarina pacifica TaxID=1296415 RepID=UPI0013767396|nr:porin family protein [Aquimarina pacifica]
MKNNILILLGLLFISGTFYSQDESEQLYTRAGFKTGINYATITGDITDVDPRVRMHLGAVIEFPVTSRFFIQAEPMYSAQGYTITEEGVENKISLNYLVLPVIGKYYMTNTLSLETGIQVGTLANASQSQEETSDEFYNSFSNTDYSWVFGTGYKFESGLFFQARYILGLTNINDLDALDIDFKHSIMQVSIGYLFKTKNNRRLDNKI